MMILEGCKDTRRDQGLGLFPECLRSELHEIRHAIEAYSNRHVLLGHDSASACGLMLHKGTNQKWNHLVRVIDRAGDVRTYKLDRWE